MIPLNEIKPGTNAEISSIEAVAQQCFMDKSTVAVSVFTKALQERNVVTRKNLKRIVESTNYLALANNYNLVVLTSNTFTV